jgi:hypothetical protein
MWKHVHGRIRHLTYQVLVPQDEPQVTGTSKPNKGAEGGERYHRPTGPKTSADTLPMQTRGGCHLNVHHVVTVPTPATYCSRPNAKPFPGRERFPISATISLSERRR